MDSSQALLSGSEVAVIGMAGRFPGAATLDAFWQNLALGVESVRRFTPDALRKAGESAEHLSDPDYVNARPVLDNIDLFDAEFFGMSPQDAAITDPQHRLFLEIGWEAFEHAGYDTSRFAGQVGVFATCGMNSYMMYHLVTNPRVMRTVGEWLVRHTGNDMSFLATSLSYQLDLKGPSMNVQCACSSALVAIHLAAQSLLAGECDMALAGGSVVILPQDRGYLYQQGEILARDGHCRPFDARATGTLFGSGAGAVVLRRLTDAVAAGDHVLAVIKGSAVNNDGSMKVGFLAPSVEGQSRAIAEALTVSGIEPDTISYIEAHGTGTIVGDPIELMGLTDAFRRYTSRRGFCRVGSLKSNIGHLGEAAGVAGFIKTVLSLQHRQIPPTVNYESPNPRMEIADTPFVVNDRLVEWVSDGWPRRAGITALGAGGTNCHVIVEEAPRPSPPDGTEAEQLLILSAKTPAALQDMRLGLAAHLATAEHQTLADIAYTLHVGRRFHEHRWTGVSRTRTDAVTMLASGGHMDQAPEAGARAPVVFLFPGGGAQYPNMGRGLYAQQPVFRKSVDQCLTHLRSQHGVELAEILFPTTRTIEDAAQALSRSTQSILSIFVIEYALSRLWMSWDIVPAAMSGHSLGEYVAACVAGVMSVEDALAIVKARGDVFERLPAGAMLSVLLPEAELAHRLIGRLAIAAINGPSTCVVSGPADDIAAFDQQLRADHVETQPLHIAVAAHSAMLDPFLDEFHRTVSKIRLSRPTLPFVSNLTGTWMTPDDAIDPAYWVRHLRQTVRFSDGLSTLLASNQQILLEVGPGRALTSLARQHPAKPLGVANSLRHPNENVSDMTTILTALGRLWGLGAAPDWAAFHAHDRRGRVPLPTYPFQRRRHWIDAGTPVLTAGPPEEAVVERRPSMAEWFHAPVWTPSPPDALIPGEVRDVLVFADDDGLALEAVGRLPATGRRVHVVQRGPQFSQPRPDLFVVNAQAVDDHVALFETIGDAMKAVSHIVYGWTLHNGEAGAIHTAIDEQLDQSFFGPMVLAQAIGRQDFGHALSVAFITSGIVEIAGETPGAPLGATVLGPARVMSRELPLVRSAVIDVVRSTSAWQRERTARYLATEIAGAGTERTVAYRGSTRWLESEVPRPLAADGRSRLRNKGVYLITGGLGSLGLETAVHLARTRQADLVLISRHGLPDRTTWDRWLSEHAAEDSTSLRISRIRDCEALGSRVLVAPADVANATELAGIRGQIATMFGRVNGIFHAAGVLDDGLMQLKGRDSALAVLRPKVHGTLALHEIFGRDGLDFIVLFSSVSSILGLQGQADYTAANAFLDAFATQASAGSTPIVSVNWGPWRDVGLAVGASRGRHDAIGRPAAHPWLGTIHRGSGHDVAFVVALERGRQWMIGEHVIRDGDAVLPGTGYLELARAAAAEVLAATAVDITDLYFQSPAIVPADAALPLTLSLVQSTSGYDCTWHTGETVYATAHVSEASPGAASSLDLEAIRHRCSVRRTSPHGFLNQPFMDFGPRWANIQHVSWGAGEAILDLALPPEFADDVNTFPLHPALIDMATGGAQALIPGFDQASDFYVPFSYGRVRVTQGLPPAVVSHVRLVDGTTRDLAVFDVTIADPLGRVLVDVHGFCMKRVSTGTTLASAPHPTASSSADVDGPAEIAEEMLRQGLTTEEGLEVLERILRSEVGSRVIVSTAPPAAWRARVDRWAAHLAEASANSPSPAASTSADGDIESGLRRMWVDLLGVSTVGPEDNFFDVGGHSLLAVRLLTRIEKTFRCSIPLHALFTSGTIRDLAERIRASSAGDAQAEPADSDDAFALTAVPRDQLRLDRSSLDNPLGN